MDWQDRYRRKLATPQQAVRRIRSHSRIAVGHAAGEPLSLIEALIQQRGRYRDVELLHMETPGPAGCARPGMEAHFRHNAVFVGDGLTAQLAGAGAFAMSYELDLLTLGDEVAQSLGLSARAARNLLLTLAAVLCGAAVSFAGLVGFVGLLVPHAARFLVGGEHKYLLAASLFLGAALVTVCDLAARVLFVPFELPVGILLSLMGGPFFLWLLFRQRGGRRT